MKILLRSLILSLVACQLQAQSFHEFVPGEGTQHADIGIADINNDGHLDIVVGGRTDGGDNNDTTMSCLIINNGDTSFTKVDNTIAAGRYASYDFGDIDGDGDLDVIFNSWNTARRAQGDERNTVNGIAHNDGNGVFEMSDLKVNTSAPSCGFADLNNDALLDYFMFGRGVGQNVLFFQNNDGSFREDTSTFANYEFNDPEVSILDFNKDGYLDMIVNGFDELNTTRISALFLNDM
ncbi:MAG: VCBS repeat-containing protein, partial [Bacteroidales bacterium]|nr:VCBS repeat-containing protein [Bacteroidales bacterium]